MRSPLLLSAVAVAACTLASSVAASRTGVPALVFPVVGSVTYSDDFGQARPGGTHEGNDLVADKRAPAVAVEPGTVEYWTTSASAGCMLYLHGDSGTMYEYIHLNNDLTAANDNKGTCTKGVAYAVPNNARVDTGQVIGYVGDSGDANGIHAHLHFEVHPKGKAAVDPYPLIKRAPHLLVAAPPVGSPFTLRLTGTVVTSPAGRLSLKVDTLMSWPSHLKQAKLNRVVTLDLPTDAAAASASATPVVGEAIVAWTLPSQGTLAALTGAPGALSLDRFVSR
jgi:peptidase M23-like protein